jgi:hypothetical protein
MTQLARRLGDGLSWAIAGVTVSVSDEALITEGGDAAGRLTFVADEGDLAVTGADVASALLWSSGLLLVGAALLLLASRRTQPETD